jgi:hypothetical protein
MTGAFAALAANPKLSHAEALAEIRVKRTNTRAPNSNADEMALPKIQYHARNAAHFWLTRMFGRCEIARQQR